MPEQLRKLVDRNADYVVALRRHLHMYPEVGTREVETQRKIMDELRAFGLTPRAIGGTGVIAEIKGAFPGKTVALRADIDALPIQDECGKPYQSRRDNACHACGHDGHTAMLAGAAKILSGLRDELAGSIRLLFQPNEERMPGGASALVAEGALEGVDYVLGAHLWQPLPAGTIGVTYGRMMAAPDEFSIVVTGKGGHGSMPHQTVDSLLVGAQLAVALNTIVSRSVDPLANAVLSLGVFRSGDVFNVIPDRAELSGTVRTFEEEVRESIFARIEQTAKGICQAAGASCELHRIVGYPPVINHPEVSRVVAEAGRAALGPGGVVEITPVMGAEDFSYYLQQVPGAFFFIGAGNEAAGAVYPHHHPKFDIDEKALGYGMEVLVRAALRLLGEK
ncbi:MAG TPA: amidohydrolase [Selenomonadales bacterium]|nr:amidohydrolase [Selenomonadales bacterium]